MRPFGRLHDSSRFASLEVLGPFSAHNASGAGRCKRRPMAGVAPRPHSAFRVSHPPDVSRIAMPRGPVSCRWRSWGFALQSFFLLAKSLHLSMLATFLSSASPPADADESARLQGLAPRAELDTRRPGLTGASGRCSPGLCSSSGPCAGSRGAERRPRPRRCASCSQFLLPWASSHRPSSAAPTAQALQLQPRSPAGWPSGVLLTGAAGSRLSSSTCPLEVCNLVSLLVSSKTRAALAHGFASGLEPRRRALTDPLRAA